MSDYKPDRLKAVVLDRILRPFVRRAKALGIEDVRGLAELIPDQGMAEALIEASEVHPLRGRPLSVEDLVEEMTARIEEQNVMGDESW